MLVLLFVLFSVLGFVLGFVNQRGEPTVYTKADNQIIEMGLRKALEKYLIESEEADHFNGQDPV